MRRCLSLKLVVTLQISQLLVAFLVNFQAYINFFIFIGRIKKNAMFCPPSLGGVYHMTFNISYNQIILMTEENVDCQKVIKSYSERGKLILFLENSKKITIAGKNIGTTGNKERIYEIVSMIKGKGFNIPESSIKHYVQEKNMEYVLVKW